MNIAMIRRSQIYCKLMDSDFEGKIVLLANECRTDLENRERISKALRGDVE